MEQSLSGILLSFLMLFVLLVKYWFVSIPIVLLLIIWYIKASNRIVRKVLRVILALIFISLIIGALLFFFGK